VNEALEYENMIKDLLEELYKFEKNEAWTLVNSPQNKIIIRAKWVFRNKVDE